METIDATRTVAEITRSIPGAARAFERLGIDYCCRGKEPLERACEATHLPLPMVLDMLEKSVYARALEPAPREPRQLVRHILMRHNAFTRDELERLTRLLEKVCRVHGRRHRELAEVLSVFEALAEDLILHMLKEESVLFAYIERLADGDTLKPTFGDIENPIVLMRAEHETIMALCAQLAQVTGGYTAPRGVCGSYLALYAGLKELHDDLREHVRLEDDVLFPQALAMQRTTRWRPAAR